MNEGPKISYADELRSQLKQQIEEANQIKGPYDITAEKFLERYNTRKELAQIEGIPERKVIKQELNLIFSQEKKFFRKVNPDLSDQRIFLSSSIIRLQHPSLDPFIASSSAHTREADRIDAICKNHSGKRRLDQDSQHVLENIKDVSIFIRRRGEFLLTQVPQQASKKASRGK